MSPTRSEALVWTTSSDVVSTARMWMPTWAENAYRRVGDDPIHGRRRGFGWPFGPTEGGRRLASVGAALAATVAVVLTVHAVGWKPTSLAELEAIVSSKPSRPTLPLLSESAPASSLYDAIRPELQYLITDMWSGFTGQFFSTVSLMALATHLQRIPIIPTWVNGNHYDKVVARIDDFFDMQHFYAKTRLPVVHLSDMKPPQTANDSRTDEIGCYFTNPMASNDDLRYHDISVVRFDPQGPSSTEHLTLLALDEAPRISRSREEAEREKKPFPRNMEDGSLLCFSNVWGVTSAHRRLGTEMEELMDGMRRDSEHDWAIDGLAWQNVGQHLNFTKEIWTAAEELTHRTIGNVDRRGLVTVHMRRGDFKDWYDKSLPSIAEYAKAVIEVTLSLPPPHTVLVLTDETRDLDFFASLSKLGWKHVDRNSSFVADLLEARWGELAVWMDGAVDQAIMALGSAFVGTNGSQVSSAAALRIQSWKGGQAVVVGQRI